MICVKRFPKLSARLGLAVGTLALALAGTASGVAGLAAAGAGGQPLPASPLPQVRLGHGLVPAWPQVRDRLELESRPARAGAAIHGILVILNLGRRPIDLTGACRPSFDVVLVSPTYRPVVAVPTGCSRRPWVLRPGTTRLRITVLTTTLACSVRPVPVPTPPACTAGGELPALPPGRYSTALEGSGLALPEPPSIPVVLER